MSRVFDISSQSKLKLGCKHHEESSNTTRNRCLKSGETPTKF